LRQPNVKALKMTQIWHKHFIHYERMLLPAT